MSFYLAIDAGGTKTHCWVADDTRVLSQAHGATVKLMATSEETATERLRDLVTRALNSAHIEPTQITRAAMGLAGVTSESVRNWARKSMAALVPGELLLCGDEEIALDAAFRGGPGILVVAGTGSNVAGRASNGVITRAGGWGPVLGDEGSGSWIGLEAIRAALHAQDRGIETCLLREIEQFWGLKDLGELVALGNARQRPDFSDLTTAIMQCAEAGDRLAQSVLERAGEELASAVSLVASKMTAAGCEPSDTTDIAYTGSVLARIALVRKSFAAHLATSLPQATVAETAVEPLEGALWRARRS